MYQLPVWVWPTALLGVCAIAVWRGRDEERLAAASVLAGWALTLMVFKSRSEDTQWAVLAIDSVLFAILTWMALRTRRYWPLFAAAFQLLLVVTHLARALDAGVSGWAYLTAGLVWSYLMLIAVGYGAWTAAYATDDGVMAPDGVPGAIRR